MTCFLQARCERAKREYLSDQAFLHLQKAMLEERIARDTLRGDTYRGLHALQCDDGFIVDRLRIETV
jgi:hypothetical protein